MLVYHPKPGVSIQGEDCGIRGIKPRIGKSEALSVKVWEQLLKEIHIIKFAQLWVSREHQDVESQEYNFGDWNYSGIDAGVSLFSRISVQILVLIEP